jgi:lipoprotein-releasing system permease protein
MMYELSVALKYLLPRRRQLSVSLISLISIGVIGLVVWLILVFFSVTGGLERIWVDKMTALTAPIRITPTEAYYRSYYYKIDAIASESNYQLKSLSEKLSTAKSDPYDPAFDEEIPKGFPEAEHKDLAKLAYEAAKQLPGVTVSPFEMTAATLKLNLVRKNGTSTLSQNAYIGNLDPSNERIVKNKVDLNAKDLANSDPSLLWKGGVLPKDKKQGDGILLPKSFHEAGVLAGDKGWIAYFAPTTSTVQEMRLPIFVAGFYDPGILPVGGKFILASPEITTLIRSSHNQEDTQLSQGFNLRFKDLAQAPALKKHLEKTFEKEGISPYFKIETYKEFDFTRDLIQQLHSEKNIFSLISGVIILVACSNIISMLIILVNDKRTEIGILRSMGATSFSIALIFGLAGTVMGLLGSLLGIGAALWTLSHLSELIHFISVIQGFEAFNPLFFGTDLPNEISTEALLFVSIATIALSMLSGLIPAIKASRVKPSEILRAS